MKLIVLLGLLPLAFSKCTYTCWDVQSTANTWAACTTTATLPLNFGSHTFIEEVHDGTLCGTCDHDTDRRKGMFVDIDNSWCWIAFSDLYNPRPCGPGSADDFLAVLKAEAYDFQFDAGCLEPGMYTPKTSAQVRGKAGVAACDDQAQYLGTLEHGQDFHLLGHCKDDCVWCYGNSGYPVNQEQTTVLCSDLQRA